MTPLTAPDIGTKLGGFQIEKRLGRGSFKTVFSAVNTDDDSPYPKRVAVCLPHAQDQEARRLLDNEYRIVRYLDHPGIVKVFGLEESGGLIFTVMELVEGEPLNDILKRQGHFPLAQAVDIIRQAGHALDYAHDALAIHRDIKPANIIRRTDGTVKILDFGLARLLSHSHYKASTRVGSVAYMAPEQFEGAAGLNADLWSLGVTFFQLITNTLPFMARDEAFLVKQILYDEPDLDPIAHGDFNPRLVGILKRILEKDPKKRYARSAEFLADLDAVLRHAVIVGKTDGEIEVLLRAHFPLVYIQTHEEERALRSLENIRTSMSAGGDLGFFVWRETQGLADRTGRPVSELSKGDPVLALREVCRSPHPGIYVFLDIHRHLTPVTVRMIRDAVWTVKRQRKSMVFITPSPVLPRELETDATLIFYDLPDAEHLIRLVDGISASADGTSVDGALRNDLVRSVQGLTLHEAERVLRRAVLRHGGLNKDCIKDALVQKKQMVRRDGLLEYWDEAGDFSGVGGLKRLKDWFCKRKQAFCDAGLRFGLRPPKGVVMVGVPGCGKSLSAKALAGEWHVPLLRLDMGRIYSSLLGASEANLRKTLIVASAVCPCVLWIDELEKAFSGAMDGGASARIFGTFLNWLEERQEPVFVAATANSIDRLPPEFTRKGRFDEVFYVGLPKESERKDIFSVHLARRGRNPEHFNLELLADISSGYTGAEIEEAVISGLYKAFEENSRELKTEDIAEAVKASAPLSKTRAADIRRMEQWAEQNAQKA